MSLFLEIAKDIIDQKLLSILVLSNKRNESILGSLFRNTQFSILKGEVIQSITTDISTYIDPIRSDADHLIALKEILQSGLTHMNDLVTQYDQKPGKTERALQELITLLDLIYTKLGALRFLDQPYDANSERNAFRIFNYYAALYFALNVMDNAFPTWGTTFLQTVGAAKDEFFRKQELLTLEVINQYSAEQKSKAFLDPDEQNSLLIRIKTLLENNEQLCIQFGIDTYSYLRPDSQRFRQCMRIGMHTIQETIKQGSSFILPKEAELDDSGHASTVKEAMPASPPRFFAAAEPSCEDDLEESDNPQPVKK